ncbi:MAG: DNA double-strand break repair nuclease NurA [Candidatus Micrarchaeota archaeon]
MSLTESILTLARSWLKKEDEWASLAKRLRFNSGKIQFKEALEQNLIYPTNAKKPEGAFAAIDGGIAGEEFHGLDIIISRSLAAKFEYKNGILSSHKYFPSSRPEFELNAKSGLEQFDKLRFTSLIRLRSELNCAINALENWPLSHLLLDGSIAPLVADKPPHDSELVELYSEVISFYHKLYKLSEEKNVNLIGVMKDSRGRRFTEMLARSAAESAPSLSHTSDTLFLDHLLEEGERTFAFRYSSAPSKNPVLKDLGKWAEKILTFYIKPVKGDRPLRIEFLSNSSSFDEIANTMAGLCSLHPHYAYPAILIEADLRAAIDSNEASHVIADLHTKLGKNRPLMQLRRNSRPFR